LAGGESVRSRDEAGLYGDVNSVFPTMRIGLPSMGIVNVRVFGGGAGFRGDRAGLYGDGGD
jgi:hypothetical protein